MAITRVWLAVVCPDQYVEMLEASPKVIPEAFALDDKLDPVLKLIEPELPLISITLL